GIVDLSTWARSETKRRKPGQKRLNGDAYRNVENKESDRWFAQIKRVETRIGEPGRVIHVADREADSYAVISPMVDAKYRFVVRAARDRLARSDDVECKIRELIATCEDVLAIEVPLSRRKAKKPPRANETSGAREARVARLGLRATTCELRRPRRDGPEHWVRVNIVEVHEI